MATQFPQQNNDGLIRQYMAHQQTMPYQAITDALPSPVATSSSPFSSSDTYQSQAIPETAEPATPSAPPAKKSRILRIAGIALVCMLALGIYVFSSASPSTPSASVSTTQQLSNPAPTISTLKTGATDVAVAANGKIQVYIVGAVKKPGVYTLESNARVYELLQVAGGPLPEANLVALNLAAPLSDGQEIYVTRVGETPPLATSSNISSTSTTGTTGGTTSGQININTASADDMRKVLHVSSTTAQAIISHRLQHGPFTTVEELLQVVSQAIYKKIKDQVKIA